jgi:integrating conjugative element protein (TIGR03761 family)
MSETGFTTSPNSPFPDGYDLYAEIRAVRALYDSPEPDSADPLFARFQEVKRREKQFATASLARRKLRRTQRAESGESAPGLTNTATMQLHTLDAQQLLVGTLPRGAGASMTNGAAGVLRACSAIAVMYRLTARLHPFADWALIEIETALAEIERLLLEKLEVSEKMLAVQAQAGLFIGVLESPKPIHIPVKFGAPHAYRLCALTLQFDQLVRHMRTLARAGLLTNTAANDVIHSIRTPMRSLLEQAVLGAALLSQPAYGVLTRSALADDPLLAARKAKLEARFTPKALPLPDAIREGTHRPQFFMEPK